MYILCVVRLDVGLADLAVLDLESVSLTSHTTEDGVCLEAEVQGLGELTSWVTKESDLVCVRRARAEPLMRRIMRILEEDVGVGDLLADTDGGTRGRVEASGSDGDGRSGPGEGDSTERSSERHG
ncbi:hypothetical protein HG531_002481 [Fusarium graminearum]|nr:hypothetical protein HG531_002481 [Fusarium graminearum]